MISADATLKKAAATANQASKRLDEQRYKLIVQTCDEKKPSGAARSFLNGGGTGAPLNGTAKVEGTTTTFPESPVTIINGTGQTRRATATRRACALPQLRSVRISLPMSFSR